MKLYVPVHIRRDKAGRYRAATIAAEPRAAREGTLLEDVKTRLVADLRRAAAAAPAGTLWTWFARPPGAVERPELRVALKLAGGRKEWVRGRFTIVRYPAPEGLGGSIVALPAVDGLLVHVGRGEDEADRLARALARRFENDADGLAAAQVERSERVHLLEVDVDPDALVASLGRREEEEPGLLAGPSRVRPGRRPKAELLRGETLLEVGVDLTADARDGRLGRAHGREALALEVMRVLLGEGGPAAGAGVGPGVGPGGEGEPRAVLLVGAPGAGKTAVVHEVARALAGRQAALDWRSPRGSVFTLSAGRLIAGMRYVGQWQERTLALAEEAAACEAALHVDSLPELMAAGRSSNRERTTATRLLAPWIASGALAVVAEATPEGLRRCEEHDRALVELFRVVRVPEADAGEALAIALRAVRDIERREPVAFEPRAVTAALDLLRRFVPYEAFPGKAVRFLKRVAEESRGAAGAAPNPSARGQIAPWMVVHAFHRAFGVSPSLLDDRQTLDLSAVRRAFEWRVRGQKAAVEALVDVVAAIKAGLADPEKPVAALLFVGPAGVGKTESAKALAQHLFGSEERLLRFDLNEASDPGAAERLAGAAGAPEGELTRAIRERPNAVVLLDEVEKAHPAVHDLLLQLLGEGRLTDALGRTADARNCVFVLTSNLGADTAGRDLGFVEEERAARYVRAVESFFRPELVNRIDRIVAFGALDRAILRDVAAREVEALLTREGLVRRRIFLDADPALLDRLVAEGALGATGARALRRAIERRLAAPLAAVLAARPASEGLAVRIGLAGDGGEESVAIEAEPIDGLGPPPVLGTPAHPEGGTPAGRPESKDAEDGAGLGIHGELRALDERLASLERSPERAAVVRALLDASADLAALERLRKLEVDLAALRDEVDGLRILLENRRHVDRRRKSGAWTRLDRLEVLVRSALRPAERVLLHVRPVGAASVGWAIQLGHLYGRLLARFGASPETRAAPTPPSAAGGAALQTAGELALEVAFPGAPAFLAGEEGLHEVRQPGGPEAFARLARVRAVALGPDEPWAAGLARARAGGLGPVVRKYVELQSVYDLRLERAAPADPEGGAWVEQFERPFEDLAVALAARETNEEL